MVTTEYIWSGMTPVDAANLLAGFDRPWWIAGGWAIDLFLGRTTRRHADLDVALLRGDEASLPGALVGWEINVVPGFIPWRGDRPLAPSHHQFWMRRRADGPWDLEALLEEHDGASWLYRRDHSVILPLGRFGRRTLEGVPYLAPEVALLYKAKGWDIEKNQTDFANTLPALDSTARQWLGEALDHAHPGHPWSTAV